MTELELPTCISCNQEIECNDDCLYVYTGDDNDECTAYTCARDTCEYCGKPMHHISVSSVCMSILDVPWNPTASISCVPCDEKAEAEYKAK